MAVQRGSVNALVKKFETHELDFDEPEEPYTYVPSPRIDDLKNYFETLGARDNSNWKKPRKERPAVEEPDHEVSTKVMEKILDFEPDAFEAESESLDNDYVPKLQDEKPADLDPVTTRATEKIGTSMEMEVDVVRRYLSGVQAYVFDNRRGGALKPILLRLNPAKAGIFITRNGRTLCTMLKELMEVDISDLSVEFLTRNKRHKVSPDVYVTLIEQPLAVVWTPKGHHHEKRGSPLVLVFESFDDRDDFYLAYWKTAMWWQLPMICTE
ncbi:MAG: hypothetical protein KVP17_003190 [Porospora cf. gigantea B]|uniref:uncharacterized protein n=1 Tax=Porospora cf. gigantea B TaxID=2853592 RepID=UPI0035719F0F|nr:MAG: hypothetical protein KVP17_003190 [Porospora cf. gigantea B]